MSNAAISLYLPFRRDLLLDWHVNMWPAHADAAGAHVDALLQF